MRLIRLQILLGFLVAATVMAMGAIPAMAHALVEGSDPLPNRLLLKAPKEIVLRFSEPVDPARTEMRVLDQEGRRIDRQFFRFSQDRREARLPGGLPGPGIYTVSWRTASTVDQHTYEGFFTFTVGPLRLGGFALKGGIPSGPSAWEIVARWLMFLGAAVLGGGVLAHRYILAGAMRRSGVREDTLLSLHPRWRLASRLGVGLFLIGGFGELGMQAGRAAQAAGESLFSAMIQFTAAEPGRTSVLIKFGVPLLLMAFQRRRSPLNPPRPAIGLTLSAATALPAIEVSLTAVLLLGISLTSHAAASGRMLPLLADWLHLLSAAVWVGGLVYLGLILAPTLRSLPEQDRGRLLGPLVQQFSNLALAGVFVLVGTGIYASVVNIPNLGGVAATAYGRTLAVKIILLLPLLAIAAVNLLIMRPRLADAGRRVLLAPLVSALQRRFFRLVRSEVALASLILLAAAALALLPTARQTLALAPERAVKILRQGEGLEGLLRIDPYQVGENTFEARLRSQQSALPITDARVRLTFLPLMADLGTAVAEAAPQGDGRYIITGGYIAARGPWLITVAVRLRGREDVKLLFPVEPDWARGAAITPTTDLRAAALLQAADRAMNRLKTVRQRQEIADGSGNAVVTFYEFAAPNAMHYRVVGGNEAIFIGDRRFDNNGSWERSQAPEPFRFPNFTYFKNSRSVVLGPREVIDGRVARAVVFILELGGAQARYTVWVEEGSRRIVREIMVARSHYMTNQYSDYNAPLQIQPPLR